MMNFSRSSPKPHHQVFISFRGPDLRGSLMSLLTQELERSDINFYIDENETRGSSIKILFDRIRESSVALVFFSNKYPESCWCLDELVEIKKQMETGSLVPFPVFYHVKAESVKTQSGYFRNSLLRTEDNVRKKVNRESTKSILETEAMIWGWRQALVSVGQRMGFSYKHVSDEAFVCDLVVKVKEMVNKISPPRNYHTVKKNSLITKPRIAINGFDSLRTDHLVFLDLNSLKNPVLQQRLITETGQAEKILLVLLGSLDDYNESFAFKPLLFPKKSQQFTRNKLSVSSQEIQDQSYSSPVQVTTIAGRNDSFQNSLGEHNNSSDALTCFSFLCDVMKLFTRIICPPSPRVSISFGDKNLKEGLVSLLVSELESNQISVCVEDETKQRIKESKVSIVVFSEKYPDSQECLDELVEIKTLMDAGEINPFPIFYKLKDESVKDINGWFRYRLVMIEYEVRKNVNRGSEKSILDTEARIWGWRQALSSIASRQGLVYKHKSDLLFVADVVTKVKELCATKERPKKSISYKTTDRGVEKPLMHRQETAAAITTDKSMDDDDLFYSLSSFLQALNLEITDSESFKEISNGLVSLTVKEHTNLVFLNLNSLKNLVRFQRPDAFELLQMGFAFNPSGVKIFEESSPVLATESNQSLQWSSFLSSQDHQIPSKHVLRWIQLET